MRERNRVSLVCGPTRTKQSFREQVNINSILARHRRSGMLDHVNGKTPFYGDVSGIADYQEALNVVHRASELFNGMSAAVRRRFDNDPVRMIEFLQDPSNLKEAQELGMVVKPPVVPANGGTPPLGGDTPPADNPAV